jgi:hypothetical protein
MPRFVLPTCALLFIAGHVSAQGGAAVPKAFGWYSTYENGLAEAKRTGKPIFLVFRCEP